MAIMAFSIASHTWAVFYLFTYQVTQSSAFVDAYNLGTGASYTNTAIVFSVWTLSLGPASHSPSFVSPQGSQSAQLLHACLHHHEISSLSIQVPSKYVQNF